MATPGDLSPKRSRIGRDRLSAPACPDAFEHNGFCCVAARCWHASIGELPPGELREAFADFVRRFPDHPSDINTSIYLAYDASTPPMWSMYWYCSHFEHGGRDDISQLVEFLDVLGNFSEWTDCCNAGVEHFDGDAECIELVLHEPREEIRSLILSVARELSPLDD